MVKTKQIEKKIKQWRNKKTALILSWNCDFAENQKIPKISKFALSLLQISRKWGIYSKIFFFWLITEITQDLWISSATFETLQQISEIYLIDIFEGANLYAIYIKQIFILQRIFKSKFAI